MRSCAAALTSSVGVLITMQVTHVCKLAEAAALQIHDKVPPQAYTYYILSIERHYILYWKHTVTISVKALQVAVHCWNGGSWTQICQ